MDQRHPDAADVRTAVAGLRLRHPAHVDFECGRPETDGVSYPVVYGHGMESQGIYPADGD